MKIRFTGHAKNRCEQRKLSQKWVEARLLTIPFAPSKYKHERLLEGTNVFVAYFDGSTYRTVITVYLTTEPVDEPKIDVRHLLNDTDVRDLVTKAVVKSKKRNKSLRRMNKKKRW